MRNRSDGELDTERHRQAVIFEGEKTKMVRRKTIRMTEGSLATIGVELVNPTLEILECLHCGCVWAAPFKLDGNLVYFWWRCPEGERRGENCWEKGPIDVTNLSELEG